jgi:hypothetical protein
MNKENDELENIKNFNEENKAFYEDKEKKEEIKASSFQKDKEKDKNISIDINKKNLEKSNNKRIKNNFLSLSEIEFDCFILENDNKKRKSNFSLFMDMKKYEDNYQKDIKIIEYDSNKEDIYLLIDKKKIKIRLFLKSNCLTAFNFLTNFSIKNSDFYPLINLDFDFLSAEFLVEKNTNSINLFILGYNNKKFSIIIPNNNLFEKLIYILQLIIYNSKGYQRNILTIVKRKEFYKVNKISYLYI